MKLKAPLCMFFLLCSLLFMAVGCSEEPDDTLSSRSSDGRGELSLCLSVPGSTKVVVRSASEADENQLGTVDVLWFTPSADGTGNEIFSGRTSAVPDKNGGSATRIARVYLPSTLPSPVRIVVLANLRPELARAAGGTVSDNLSPKFKDLTKDEVFSAITYDTPGRWPGGESGTWRPLPMWGESKNPVTVSSSLTQNQIGTIALLRATARIDVGCAWTGGTPGTLDNFQLASVAVYNMDNAGRAVPLPVHFSAAGGAGGKGIVTLPTPVPDAGKVAASDNGYTAASSAVVRKIYVPEASVTYTDVDGNEQPKSDTDACCLVVGGYYNHATELSYYRVDFRLAAVSGEKQRVPLLRNHLYKVNITSVRGAGATNADAAFADCSVGNIIQWDIEARDESSLDNVVFDGRYHLTTSAVSLGFYRTGPQRVVDVYTDHPDGWKVTDKPDWIRFEDETGASLTELPSGKTYTTAVLRVNVTGEPPLGLAREGTFTLTAGGLKQTIALTQQSGDYLDLTITPEKLYFSKSAPTAQDFTIQVPPGVPADAQVTYSFVPSETMEAADFVTLPTITGSGTYSIQPGVFNTTGNTARESFVSVTITKGNEIVQRLLTVIQRAYDGLAQVIARQYYATAGSTGTSTSPDQTFSVDVHSDNEWRIGLNEDYYTAHSGIARPTDSWLTLYDEGTQSPTGDGSKTYCFEMTPNYTYQDRTAMMTSYDMRAEVAAGEKKNFNFALLQKGEPLLLNILSPAPTPPATVPKIDFGSALDAAPKTIRFRANSKWMWKLNAAGVIKSYTAKGEPTKDDSHPVELGDGNPWTYVTDEIILTPFTYGSIEDIPMDGDLNGEMILRSVLDAQSIAAGVKPLEYTIPVVRSFGSVFSVTITVDGVPQKMNTELNYYKMTDLENFSKSHEVRIRVTSNKGYSYFAPDGTEQAQGVGTHDFSYTVPAGKEGTVDRYKFRIVSGARTVSFGVNMLGYVLNSIRFKDPRLENGWTNGLAKKVILVVNGVYENLQVNFYNMTQGVTNLTGGEQEIIFDIPKGPEYISDDMPIEKHTIVSVLLGERKEWSYVQQQPYPQAFEHSQYGYFLNYTEVGEINDGNANIVEPSCRALPYPQWGPGGGYSLYPDKPTAPFILTLFSYITDVRRKAGVLNDPNRKYIVAGRYNSFYAIWKIGISDGLDFIYDEGRALLGPASASSFYRMKFFGPDWIWRETYGVPVGYLCTRPALNY